MPNRNKSDMTVPEWTRLENSAIIYPSCRTRKYATVFRLSVTLDSSVDPDRLQDAMCTVIQRFPSFRYTVRRGFFWWFLQKLENEPVVGARRDLVPIDIKRNGGYMFSLNCKGDRIDLDVYHALSDANGAMTFLLSVVAEYLRITGAEVTEYGKWIVDPFSEPVPEEIEDGFDRFSGTKGSLDDEKRAWHIKGKNERPGIVNSLGVSFSSSDVLAKARELDCTVTEFISTLILLSLQEVHAVQKGRKSPFIRMEVPVNLRPIFGSNTMRNFASYVYLTLDVTNGIYSFEQALKEVKFQKRLYVQPARLTRKIAANVALEDNIGVRCLPLFIKKPIINLINYLKGDNYGTYTFSNVGNIDLPEAVAAHVKDINFALGRTRGRSGSCAGVSFGGRMNINFTRKIAEDDLERIFVRRLREMGIWASVQVPAIPLRPSKGSEPARKAVFRKRSLIPGFLFSL